MNASIWQTIYNVDGTSHSAYAVDCREMLSRFPKVWSKTPWPEKPAAPAEPAAPVLKGAALAAAEKKAARLAAEANGDGAAAGA